MTFETLWLLTIPKVVSRSDAVGDMLALISAPRSLLICRLNSRATLELEVVALRH
jgi:hypothetical protein